MERAGTPLYLPPEAPLSSFEEPPATPRAPLLRLPWAGGAPGRPRPLRASPPVSPPITTRPKPRSEAGAASRTPDALAAAHARFARAALGIYVATAAIACVLLDRGARDRHGQRGGADPEAARPGVRRPRARALPAPRSPRRRAAPPQRAVRGQPRGPGPRAREEPAPALPRAERVLQRGRRDRRLAGRGHPLGAAGLPRARGELRGERWFGALRRGAAPRIVPVQPDRADSVLYVVSPLIREGEFSGALARRGGPRARPAARPREEQLPPAHRRRHHRRRGGLPAGPAELRHPAVVARALRPAAHRALHRLHPAPRRPHPGRRLARGRQQPRVDERGQPGPDSSGRRARACARA